ncbi:hypothetical protein BC827DRAFT_296479 [Russula dissimulans]|nr:hypothetical protein BC827DRAFT_296479 [Russula dissimulans]
MLDSCSKTSAPPAFNNPVSPSLILQTSPTPSNGGRINPTASPVESSTSSSVCTPSSTPMSTPTSLCKLTPISPADKKAYLEAHNDFRRNHSVPLLTWKDTLSAYARNWTCGCQWKHSQGPYGENPAAGTVFPPLDVVILWGSEESA